MMASDEVPCFSSVPEPKIPPVKGKLYQKVDIGGEILVKDSAWAAARYLEGVGKLAEAAAKVREAKEAFDVAQATTDDNGDPSIDSDQILVKLAEAIGSAWEYRNEYLQEVPEEDKD